MKRVDRVAFMAVACLVVAGPVRGATIGLLGTGGTGTVGAAVTIEVQIKELAAPGLPSLGSFDIDLLFDPIILAVDAVSFTDASSSVNQLDFPEPGSFGFLGGAAQSMGRLDLFGVSGNSAAVLNASQLSAFSVATVTFRVLAAQATTVALDLLDPGLLFGDSAGAPLTLTAGPATATFTPVVVPEAGSVFLLALGLAAGVSRVRGHMDRTGGRR